MTPTVAALCVLLSETDPCGPDLDLSGDAQYLNFFAQTEGILPSSFFSAEDGKPFDRTSVDLPRQIEAIAPLWERSRDLRLLVIRARLMILNRDLAGFAVSIAAIAEWLDKCGDEVHPRAADGNLDARVAVLGSLDLPTVVFPLQYAPLCEGRRIGAVTYRSWMIASGEVKPRAGEQKQPSATLTEAIADAPADVLAATRKHVAMLKTSLGRVRDIFMMQGTSLGLENLSALVDKIQLLVDPQAVLSEETPAATEDDIAPAGDTPASLADAQQALAAIAEYYSRSEPSSPTLPLVRQAHQLIGKSFFEVMSILVPTQMDKAAFQIGADQFFELPVGKLSKLPEGESAPDDLPSSSRTGGSPQYRVASRAAGDRAARTGPAILPTLRALQPGADAVRSCTCPRRARFHGRAEGGASEGSAEDFRRRKMRSAMLGQSKANRIEDVELRNRCPLPNARTMVGLARRTDARRPPSGDF